MAPEFEGSAIVTGWFGRWPSFHDAEVLSADFHRGLDQSGFPVLSVKMHAFEMTREVDDRGYFKTIKHCVIELGFDQVAEVELKRFTQQNVRDDISLSVVAALDRPPRLAVGFEALTEMELRFSCSKAIVVDLTPGIPAESIYNP